MNEVLITKEGPSEPFICYKKEMCRTHRRCVYERVTGLFMSGPTECLNIQVVPGSVHTRVEMNHVWSFNFIIRYSYRLRFHAMVLRRRADFKNLVEEPWKARLQEWSLKNWL